MTTTKFDEFTAAINVHEFNTAEWAHLCEVVTSEQPIEMPPFVLQETKNKKNMILTYTPTNDSIILTPAAKDYFITWIEKKYMSGEPYFAYLAVKEAMEKDND